MVAVRGVLGVEIVDLFHVELVCGMLQQILCRTMLTMALTFLQACPLYSGGCYLRLPKLRLRAPWTVCVLGWLLVGARPPGARQP